MSEMTRDILNRLRRRQGGDEGEVACEQTDQDRDKRLEDYLAERARKHKQRLLDEVDFSDFDPEKRLLAHFYTTYLPTWKEAKVCYRQNRRFENWPAIVALAFPDLPDDLVHRLGNHDAYMSMPSALALEEAARTIGIAPDTLGLRALQHHLKESKDWAASVGPDEVDKLLAQYLHKVTSDIIGRYKILDSLQRGDEPDFRGDSLMHERLAPILKESILKILRENDESEEQPTVR
jgi:hypothetical protein